MEWIGHGQQLFIFFTFPLIGLAFDSFFRTRTIYCMLILACIVLTPVFVGYSYSIAWVNKFLVLIAVSCVFSLLLDDRATQGGKNRAAVIISGVLFLVFGFMAMVDGFAGTQTVEKKWQTAEYRVEYIRDQGFAGGPLMKYELSKLAMMAAFIKKIETQVDDDTTRDCDVYFLESRVVLDKCKDEISEIQRQDGLLK